MSKSFGFSQAKEKGADGRVVRLDFIPDGLGAGLAESELLREAKEFGFELHKKVEVTKLNVYSFHPMTCNIGDTFYYFIKQ